MNSEIIARLKNVAIFAAFKDDERSLEIIASTMQRKSYHAGQKIIQEGDEGEEDVRAAMTHGCVEELRRWIGPAGMGPTGPSARRAPYFFFFLAAFFFFAILSPPSRTRASRGWLGLSRLYGEPARGVKRKIHYAGGCGYRWRYI